MPVKRGVSEAAAQRRLKSIELRKAGLTYREIAGQLDISEAQAFLDVKRILKESFDGAKEDIEAQRQIELERIDRLWTRAYENAMAEESESGDVDRFMRICAQLSKRRAELLGLDMPVKVAPTDPSGQEAWAGPICLSPLEEIGGNGGGNGDGDPQK